MRPNALYSSRLKHQWAQRHLDALFADMDAFYRRPESAKGFRRPTVEIWSLVVADAVHNMRVALDHAAYDIARADLLTRSLAKKPSRDTAFPLLTSPNRGLFDKQLVDIKKSEVRALIESLQPYGKRNLLWILAELNNTDKHERLNIFPALMTFETNLSGLAPGESVMVDLADGSTRRIDAQGNPLAEPPPSTPSVRLQLRMPRSGNEFDVSVLRDLHEFVGRDVLTPMAGFLVDAPPEVIAAAMKSSTS